MPYAPLTDVQPIDGNGARGAAAVERVGQHDLERVGRLENPGGRKKIDDRLALVPRGREEMRVQPGLRTAIEPAHGIAVGKGHVGGRPCHERLPGPRPAGYDSTIEVADFTGIRGDEVVVGGNPVELDNGRIGS